MYAAVSFGRMLLPELESAWLLPILILTGGATYVGAAVLLDRALVIDLRRVAAAVRG